MAITKTGKEVTAGSESLIQYVARAGRPITTSLKYLSTGVWLAGKGVHRAGVLVGKVPIPSIPKKLMIPAAIPGAVVLGAEVYDLPYNLRKNLIHADPNSVGTIARPAITRALTRRIEYYNPQVEAALKRRNLYI